MNIVVTGGAGFIGSHLCEKLLELGHSVTSLDNYSTGKVENHIQGVNYISGHTKHIQKHIIFTPDIIYHLGEYSRVEKSFDDIELVLDSNLHGTLSVLEFCRKNKCKLIYAGSSTKFGDNGNSRNESPYAWSKSSNTELVKNYSSWFNMEYAITYFYNVYGGREIAEGEYATVIGIFTRLYKQNKPLPVVSPGTQQRNFTHIDDIVSGLILVGFEGEGDNYGIGHEQSYTILEIAELFQSKIKLIPERRGNRMTSFVYTERIRALGWKPTKSLENFILNITQTHEQRINEDE